MTSAVSVSLSNPLKRGIATAISWINPGFRFFGPGDWRLAITHLGVTHEEARILDELRALQKSLPPNETLALILGAIAKAS